MWGQIIQFVGKAYSGYSALLGSLDTASATKKEGAIKRASYDRQANLTMDDGNRLRSKQAMQYISYGVEISGTPQLVLAETMAKAEAEARSYRATGQAVYDLADQNSKNIKKSGVSSLISSIIGGASSAIGSN
jgi:hypothetical protein